MTNNKEIVVLKNNDITKPIDIVNKREEQISYFSKEDMIELLNKVPPNNYGMLFQFLWRTGVRVSEALGVTKKDIDLENQELKIRWLKNRKYDTRIIPLHNSLKLPLYTFTAKLNNDDKIFNFTRQYVDQLCKKYGFNHAHKIRHSFAINFLRQSDSPSAFVILQHLLGHNHINTTMVYLKAVPMEQKKALEKISFD
jgi:integrase